MIKTRASILAENLQTRTNMVQLAIREQRYEQLATYGKSGDRQLAELAISALCMHGKSMELNKVANHLVKFVRKSEGETAEEQMNRAESMELLRVIYKWFNQSDNRNMIPGTLRLVEDKELRESLLR